MIILFSVTIYYSASIDLQVKFQFLITNFDLEWAKTSQFFKHQILNYHFIIS